MASFMVSVDLMETVKIEGLCLQVRTTDRAHWFAVWGWPAQSVDQQPTRFFEFWKTLPEDDLYFVIESQDIAKYRAQFLEGEGE